MKVELLAPAGSFESLRAAAGAGADAVYLGGSAFGARAYAKNFQKEELLEAIDYMHLLDKKLYLTVNTLVKNKELEQELYAYLAPLYEQGLDAVLVQDMGVYQFIRRNFPELPIHGSTQMAITGVEGARFMEAQGMTRMVPARELSLEEIAKIHQGTNLEIETFIHGALCYSYSGQCLFSSILGGRSGNRGRCAQPCRLPYEGEQKDSGKPCPLSMRDINTLDILPEIIRAGVCSLKIEGRMKQPEYAAGVVSVYRKYLDLYESNAQAYQVQQKDRELLQKLFHRGGFCKGYYVQKNGSDMIAFTNDKKTTEANVSIQKPEKGIDGFLSLEAGASVSFTLLCGEHSVTAKGDMVQKAQKQPLARERVESQMKKNTSAVFTLESLEITMGADVFIPMGALNQVRREAYRMLEDSVLKKFRREPKEKPSYLSNRITKSNGEEPSVYASFETREQMQVILQEPAVTGVMCPISLMEELLSQPQATEKKIVLVFPHVVRNEELNKYKKKIQDWIVQGVSGILVRNLEGIGFLKSNGWLSLGILDHFLYTFNNESVAFWDGLQILGNTVPLELNMKEIKHRDNSRSFQMIYGYLPLMVSAQCVQKNLEKCRRNYGTMKLVDRYEKKFFSKCYCDTCYNVIYNCVPMQLTEEMQQIRDMGIPNLRMDFTLEDKMETQKILAAFLYQRTGFSPNTYTKGHFKRGVE